MKGANADMSIVSRTELESLVQQSDDLCLSIFMPTHRAGDQIQQDPVRLKNLLGQAEEQLINKGLRAAEAKEFLEPVRALIPAHGFWRHQSDGLAIFHSAGTSRYYRLPIDFDELVVVSERFHIKPLLPLLSGDGRYFLLAVSQGEVRLLQGSRFSISQVDLEDVPRSLEEALKWDDPERQLQWHTGTGAQSDPVQGAGWISVRGAVFHGHGVDPQDEIRHYFHRIDEGIGELLAGEQTPLVLAGVDYLHPIYHEANSYQHLLEEGVIGNPEEESLEELHQQAWDIVAPVFQQDREEATAQYQQLAGTGSTLASADLEEIVPSAYIGRIDTLFVATDVQRWGTFDRESFELHVHQDAEAGDEDLLDFAAVHTLLNDGTVYAVEPENVPGSEPVAAIFRYEMESQLSGG